MENRFKILISCFAAVRYLGMFLIIFIANFEDRTTLPNVPDPNNRSILSSCYICNMCFNNQRQNRQPAQCSVRLRRRRQEEDYRNREQPRLSKCFFRILISYSLCYNRRPHCFVVISASYWFHDRSNGYKYIVYSTIRSI